MVSWQKKNKKLTKNTLDVLGELGVTQTVTFTLFFFQLYNSLMMFDGLFNVLFVSYWHS